MTSYQKINFDNEVYRNIPGEVRTRLLLVASACSGHYEWDQIEVLFDPQEEHYYVGYDSGCSCNYWGDQPVDWLHFTTKKAARDDVASYGDRGWDRGALVIEALSELDQFSPRRLKNELNREAKKKEAVGG